MYTWNAPCMSRTKKHSDTLRSGGVAEASPLMYSDLACFCPLSLYIGLYAIMPRVRTRCRM